MGAGHNAEYFGVVSYKLREKIGSVMKENWSGLPQIANHSLNKFTPTLFANEIEKHRPDVMSFQRHIPHNPITFANKFHPNFSIYFERIISEVGLWCGTPYVFNDVFYCNYFVAKSDIYESYVKDMLIPAMEVMKSMPELMGNSGYPHQLPKHLAEKFGINHYPYHAFLCERMFTYYVWIHNLKCLHY